MTNSFAYSPQAEGKTLMGQLNFYTIEQILMFPIPPNLQVVKDFNEADYRRKRLLLEELQYCNRKAQQIASKAQHVYRMATTESDPHIAEARCDFKRLESYLAQYISH